MHRSISFIVRGFDAGLLTPVNGTPEREGTRILTARNLLHEGAAATCSTFSGG